MVHHYERQLADGDLKKMDSNSAKRRIREAKDAYTALERQTAPRHSRKVAQDRTGTRVAAKRLTPRDKTQVVNDTPGPKSRT